MSVKVNRSIHPSKESRATDPGPESGGYYDRGYHASRHANLILDDEYFWARAKASTRLYFKPEERASRIFEYGCGVGQSIATLPNAAGWDISGEALEACRHRGLRVYSDFEEVPKGAWDIVLCRHALEHMPDPKVALQRMRTLLSGNGQIYIIVPMEKHGAASFAPDSNRHLFSWTFRTLNNLLWECGFEATENRVIRVLGYRALLPLRRFMGERWYEIALKAAGWFLRNGELAVKGRLRR
ncbi:MAG TPA: class I SAM-dependent methyltransferase [Bryobacteraceae bacterium]|nr:hypothetical protein [Bryobacterales bacterium]HRJ20193.1 class I SAM-dependent methyltransferase [Bryobacteraceae bacterium]